MFAVLMKNHARLAVNQLRMALNTGSTSFCKARVRMTNRKMVAAEMRNTLPWMSSEKENSPLKLSWPTT